MPRKSSSVGAFPSRGIVIDGGPVEAAGVVVCEFWVGEFWAEEFDVCGVAAAWPVLPTHNNGTASANGATSQPLRPVSNLNQQAHRKQKPRPSGSLRPKGT